jgi:hypothetical protein
VDSKSFSRVEIKAGDKGQVNAVFSTFNVLDKDSDITLPGAFAEGAPVVISAYGHKSWEGALPVGDGVIRTTAKEAVLDGQFYMDTTHGADAFRTVKRLAERGLGQWSYGYDVQDADYGEMDGKQVRYLKRLSVTEVSPVLIGAGVNTRTLATKGLSPNNAGGAPVGFAYKAAIKPHDTQIIASRWDAAAMVKGIPQGASLSDLRSMFAWVDPEADPDVKSSYKFPHHMGIDEAANVRACIMHIAALNGARAGAYVPEEDRKGVYNHLAAHLRDADRTVPELRNSSGEGGIKFRDETGKATIGHYEELAVVLCDLASLRDRTAEIVALRSKKGRNPLSAASGELLSWVQEEMREMAFLLTPTEDEAAYEYLRFLRNTLGEQTT